MQSSDNSERGGTEVERVDLSRILHYVSPRELERFENEQFRAEAEAQAVADREEEEEQVRRRMAKNARLAAGGQGRGSQVLDGLEIDPELQPTGLVRGPSRGRRRWRGRSRGRGRGSGSGKGRGSWRGRGGMTSGPVLLDELPQDEIVDSQPSQTYTQPLPRSLHDVAETSIDSEEVDSEQDFPEPTSSGMMRSAFVANSALPLSPVRAHRSAPPVALRRFHAEVPDVVKSTGDEEDLRESSMANQLQLTGVFDDTAIAESQSVSSNDEARHRSKRQKTSSEDTQQELMFPPSSQIASSDLESEDDSIPADRASTVKAHKYHSLQSDAHATPLNFASPESRTSVPETEDASGGSDEAAEEFVVESILEHYYNEGQKYYLVKWEGYEDSHDWILEDDLAGASALVREYNERVRRQKGKERAQ